MANNNNDGSGFGRLVPQRPGVISTGGLTDRGMIDRAVAQQKAPSPTAAGAENTTEISTYFAKPSLDGQPAIIYNGDRLNARIILVLETAGPVDVGTQANILPVGSNKGVTLKTGVPFSVVLTKGNRLYIAASATNRIARVVEPIPYQEQIVGLLGAIAGK